MRIVLTSIIIAAGMAMAPTAEAHPPSTQVHSRVQVQLVWVWVPRQVSENGILIRGHWQQVRYGDRTHVRHRHHRPVSRHVHAPRGRHHKHPRRHR